MGIRFQKIAGAILFALILLWGAGILSRILIPEDEIHIAEAPSEATQAAGAPATGEAPADAVPLPQFLAAADPAAGQAVAKKCSACHTFEPGGPHRVGPNLAGIVSAAVAAKQGYAYSPALQQYGGDWTVERLAAFLTKPSQAVPGTKMTFAGLSDPEDRANIIAYLHSLSPDAPPLPTAEAQTAAPAAPEAPATR